MDWAHIQEYSALDYASFDAYHFGQNFFFTLIIKHGWALCVP